MEITMNFTTSFNSLENLYELHLNSIKNSTFTFREIDVIACIMHNRGEKKIAALLLVSPRTISAHVYNIMGKLGFSIKDQIIDFIESSNKLPIINEYYLHLLIKSNFEQKLIKIASQVNRIKLDWYYNRNDKLNISEPLYQSLKKHLQLANIFLHEANITGLNDKLVIELNKITEQNYYNDLLQILLELINSNLMTEILKEFQDAYKLTQDIYEGKTNHLAISNNIDSKTGGSQKKFFIILLVLCLIAAGTLMFSFKNLMSQEQAENDPSEVIKALEDCIDNLKNAQFTADNISDKQAKHNHNIIKKIEKLLEYKNSQEIQKYFKKTEMSAEFLTSYLYNLQALAAYYMYNKHNRDNDNGDNARTILTHAKELAELYVNGRSFNNDFNQLSNAEILAELQIVDDLPQIYTRIIYSLGRTYMYDGDITPGRKYFELSKYLGNKLGLFEGYLSALSGILIIEKEIASSNLQKGQFNVTKNTIQHINESLDKMRYDDTTYILNYKPGTQVQQTIIPKNQPYNIFECGNKIIANCLTLLRVTKNNNEIREHIELVTKELAGTPQAKGLLKIAKEVPKKKLADLYNNLGNILTILWKLKAQDSILVEDTILNTTISESLSSNLTNNLELAELLFITAKDISRNSDFTKADSYEGLAQVNKLKLEYEGPRLSDQQKLELKEKIEIFTKKSQSINQQLKRKTKSHL